MMYWVQFYDGNIVMDGQRLEHLLDKIPTLRFLLFGHPDMQAKDLPEHTDGAKVVSLPEFLSVSKFEFISIIHAILGLSPLPVPDSFEMKSLLKNLTLLGGCEELEHRIRQARETRENASPHVPAHDLEEQYQWQIINHRMDLPGSLVMHQQGYSLTKFEMDPKDDSRVYLYYRKRF
eukprot:scaffold2742_cov167-Amphora_coffeaeformis.AAC.7